jgi:glucokinase
MTAGVDLGGTKIQVAVVRARKVVGSARVPTPLTGAEPVIEAMVEAVRAAVESVGAKSEDLRAVGIGSPGKIDASAGVVSHSPNVPGFMEPVDLGPRVSSRLGGIPVLLDNDVRVAVRGEHQRGAGRPYRHLLGVFVGTGVGGGLVLDGRLRTGRGALGEIGHIIVKPGGRMCSDGRRGHLEAYAGRGRMEAEARRRVAKGAKTDLFDIMRQKGRTRLSSGVWAAALDHGDRMAHDLVDDAVDALAVGLSSVQNLLDLDAIIVGGGLGDRLGEPFVRRIEQEMHPLLFIPDRPPAVLGSELRDLAGAVGAAVLAGG